MKRIGLGIASFLVWALLSILTPCFANDSIGSVAVGGITFHKSKNIRLTNEDLTIAPDDIQIRYKFNNESKNNIRATVLFPMPAYGWNSGEYMGLANERPLDDFSVEVDGHAISTRIDRRAIVGNKDITSSLRDIGLTEDQAFKTFATCINEDDETQYYCGVSEKQKRALEKIGPWKVSETAWWKQNFPSHKEIEVTHKYSPFAGVYYIYPYQQNQYDYSEFEEVSDACLDTGTINTIKKKVTALVNNGSKIVRINVKYVEYILGTGRNWKGPIDYFRLSIKKSSPDQIVSLCFPGRPKRIGSTLIEFNQKNYVPQDKVIVYFFSILKDN